MPQVQLYGEQEKLLNEVSICLMDRKNMAVPKSKETITMALQIVKNLHLKIIDSDEKRSVREVYLDSGAFDEAGEVLPF